MEATSLGESDPKIKHRPSGFRASRWASNPSGRESDDAKKPSMKEDWWETTDAAWTPASKGWTRNAKLGTGMAASRGRTKGGPRRIWNEDVICPICNNVSNTGNVDIRKIVICCYLCFHNNVQGYSIINCTINIAFGKSPQTETDNEDHLTFLFYSVVCDLLSFKNRNHKGDTELNSIQFWLLLLE